MKYIWPNISVLYYRLYCTLNSANVTDQLSTDYKGAGLDGCLIFQLKCY